MEDQRTRKLQWFVRINGCYKQNCLIWGEKTSRNAVREAVIRYRQMITEFFGPALKKVNLEDIWFQQDKATHEFIN